MPDDDRSDDTKPDTPVKLSQQLAMTPQLQLAIRLLGTPTVELPALIESWQDTHPGSIAPLAPGEVDPYDEREREIAEEEGIPAWFYYDEEPFPSLGADVWVFGDPPQVRANGRTLPRLKAVFDDGAMTRSAADIRQASWLVRGLRQRARTYENVVGALIGLRPELAIAPDPSTVAPVRYREIAELVALHESTVRRVVPACRFQTLHGVTRLAGGRSTVSFERHEVV